jgi:hypothetical protein
VPAIVFVLVAATTGDAASLAGAQFNESLRRLFVPRVTLRVTDIDIPPSSPVPPSPPASSATSAQSGAVEETATPAVVPERSLPAAAEAQPEAAPADTWPAVTDEAGWRSRAAAARASLETDQLLVEAMQSRINALTRDASARDDPAQRAELERQRLRALAEHDRLIKQVQADADAIAALTEAARRKGIPPGWIR